MMCPPLCLSRVIEPIYLELTAKLKFTYLSPHYPTVLVIANDNVGRAIAAHYEGKEITKSLQNSFEFYSGEVIATVSLYRFSLPFPYALLHHCPDFHPF